MGPHPILLVSLKGEELDMGTHGGKIMCNPEGEAWKRSFPHGPRKAPTSPTPWSYTSSLQNYEEINFCYLSLFVCGSL